MRVRCWGLSVAGTRAENQDAVAFTGFDVAKDGELLHAESDAGTGVCLALLADGVGGSADGRRAARTVLGDLQGLRLEDASEATVGRVIADVAVRLSLGARGPGSATTTLAGIAFGTGLATVFNVGDSRVYSLRPGTPRQLTVDHRSRTDSRAISRFLGGSPAHATPTISSANLVPGSWFALASDGLYAYVSLSDLEGLDLSNPQSACAGLVTKALAAGSHDNVSIILVSVGLA